MIKLILQQRSPKLSLSSRSHRFDVRKGFRKKQSPAGVLFVKSLQFNEPVCNLVEPGKLIAVEGKCIKSEACGVVMIVYNNPVAIQLVDYCSKLKKSFCNRHL